MNAVQCDWCGGFARNPEGLSSRTVGAWPDAILPLGWFAVATIAGGTTQTRAPGVTNEHGEFCSRACISDFFAAPPKEKGA